MTGTDLITKERIDQIAKHGFTVERDARIGAIKLAVAAQAVLNCEQDEWPDELATDVFHHIMRKTLEEQWAIAGALLAAAIDVRKQRGAAVGGSADDTGCRLSAGGTDVVGCQASDAVHDAGSAQPDNRQPTTDNARLALPAQPANGQPTTNN